MPRKGHTAGCTISFYMKIGINSFGVSSLPSIQGLVEACLRAHTLQSPRKGIDPHPEDSFMVCSELLQGAQASETAFCWVEEPGVDMDAMPGLGNTEGCKFTPGQYMYCIQCDAITRSADRHLAALTT